MYVVHTTIEAFLSEVARHGIAEVRAEPTIREQVAHGLVTDERHRLTLSAAVDGVVHTVRVEIDAFSRLRDSATNRRIRAWSIEHTETVRWRLAAYLELHQIRLARGLLLVPGLREDLDQLVGGQDLWRISLQERDDPTTRILTFAENWNPIARG